MFLGELILLLMICDVFLVLYYIFGWRGVNEFQSFNLPVCVVEI